MHPRLLAASLLGSAQLAAASLTGHWPLDEGTGTTTANLANPAFPASLANFSPGAEWTPGRDSSPWALNFDGIDDAANTPFTPVTGSAPRSLAAWIRYPAQSDTELDAIFSYGANTTSNRWTVRIGSTSGSDLNKLRLEVSGGGIFGNTDLNDNQWHHIAVVQSGPTLGDVTLYLDGFPQTPGFNGTGASLAINSIANPGQEAAIGSSRHAINYNFKGAIDDVRFYDHALSTQEVAALVAPAPKITSFTAVPGNLTLPGQQATLSWQGSAQPGATWSISPAPGNVSSLTVNGSGSLLVSPSATTNYTLTVTDTFGSVSASTSVGVNEPQLPLVLNEVMAANDGFLADENGDSPDWLEIHNPNAFSVSAGGWRLRDSGSDWVIPANTIIQGNGHLRIFASGKDRSDPSRNLHTNFSLSADGEFLGLFAPGTTTPSS